MRKKRTLWAHFDEGATRSRLKNRDALVMKLKKPGAKNRKQPTLALKSTACWLCSQCCTGASKSPISRFQAKLYKTYLRAPKLEASQFWM